ncbi:MAG: hypothetical protein V3S21_09625, partial [Xanthomonadales bacterium]
MIQELYDIELKIPDENIQEVKIIIRAGEVVFAEITRFVEDTEYFAAFVETIASEMLPEAERNLEIISRSLMTQFEQLVKLN